MELERVLRLAREAGIVADVFSDETSKRVEVVFCEFAFFFGGFEIG